MKLMRFLFVSLGVLACMASSAQTPPQGISYQAIARDPVGIILSDSLLTVRMGIIANEPGGTLAWQETHEVTTNAFGLFTLTIGEGVSTGEGVVPTFDLLDWTAGEYYLSVEVDPGDGLFELIGISQFLSVPYAFFADKAGSLDGIDEIDQSSTNECITSAFLNGTVLTIQQCGQVYDVDLADLISESADADWSISDDGLVVFNTSEDIGIGTQDPTSTLHVAGSMSASFSVITSNAGAGFDDSHLVYVFDLTDGDISASLPSASTCPGRQYDIKIFDPDAVPSFLTLITSGMETIDGADDPSFSSETNSTFTIMSDGAGWWVIRGEAMPN